MTCLGIFLKSRRKHFSSLYRRIVGKARADLQFSQKAPLPPLDAPEIVKKCFFSPKSLDGDKKICYTTVNAKTGKKYHSFRTCTESRRLVEVGEEKRGIHSVSSAPNGLLHITAAMADMCCPSRLRRDVPVTGQGHMDARFPFMRIMRKSLCRIAVPDEAGRCETPAK